MRARLSTPPVRAVAWAMFAEELQKRILTQVWDADEFRED